MDLQLRIDDEERDNSVGRHHPQPTRRWWHIAGSVFFALFAVLLVTGAVVVNVQHWKLEPVLSGSMRPGIQPGDLAIVRPVPADDIHVGEIIAYLPPEQPRPVLHRIVSLNAKGLVTKGDANRVDDPWGRVKPESGQIDRLVVVVPKVGFLLAVRGVLLKIIAGILLAMAAFWIWSLLRGRASKRRGRGPSAQGVDSGDNLPPPLTDARQRVQGAPTETADQPRPDPEADEPADSAPADPAPSTEREILCDSQPK